MDFPASMSYYGAASATDTYTYTSGGGSCTTPEYFEEAFTAERYYPDISTLGSGNVCYRETTPACAWGFFHGVGYGIADTDDCRYHNCITCSSNVGVTTFYGDVNNVTNRYLYSGSAINPEAKASLQSAAPATCGTVVGSCGGGFGCQQYQTCTVDSGGGSGSRYGYAGILQYMPLTSELVFKASWFPRTKFASYTASCVSGETCGGSGGTGGGPRLNGVNSSEEVWTKNTSNIFPNAGSYSELEGTDYAGGTSDSDMFNWRYSAVVDCATDFGGSPITLNLIDSAQVHTMHYRWQLNNTPNTITVTPNF